MTAPNDYEAMLAARALEAPDQPDAA